MNDNQRRLAAKIQPVRGWYYCPGWEDGRPCTSGPDGTPLRSRRSQPLGKHRHDVHGYISPATNYNKSRTKGQKKDGPVLPYVEPDTRYVDLMTQKLLKDENDGLFHCPEHEACKALYPPDGYTHTHPTSMGWHRNRVHGIKGVNAHRTKKKPNAAQVLGIMQDADKVRASHKPRRAWGSNRKDQKWIDKMATKIVDALPEQPQIIVMHGVDGCPHCRANLKPYNQVASMQQIADATGKIQQQLITIAPRESHGSE